MVFEVTALLVIGAGVPEVGDGNEVYRVRILVDSPFRAAFQREHHIGVIQRYANYPRVVGEAASKGLDGVGDCGAIGVRGVRIVDIQDRTAPSVVIGGRGASRYALQRVWQAQPTRRIEALQQSIGENDEG